jgi:sugar/nucleoside kinase (ribokinase family)
MPKHDILVAGEINPDLILSGDVVPAFGQMEKLVDAATLTIGSSSAIFACGAARLGLKVAIIGVCGDDIFGHFMLDELSKHDIDVSNVIIDPTQQTGLSVILARRADRAILTHPGAMAALQAAQVNDNLLQKNRHLHIASYFLQTALQPGLPDLFQRAHTLGLTTSLDTNWDPSSQWKGVRELLPFTDIFLPNENEAKALTGAKDFVPASQEISAVCPVVAIKLGAQGAISRHGEKIVTSQALKVDVVDTVGAGDSFDAGFMYGYLKGWNLEESLRLATVCGSLSTRAAGGTAGQPTLEEAMHYVDTTTQ